MIALIALYYLFMARFVFRFCNTYIPEADYVEFDIKVIYFITVFWPIFLLGLGIGIVILDVYRFLMSFKFIKRWWRGY